MRKRATKTTMVLVGGPADGQTFDLDDKLKGVTVPFQDGKTPGFCTYQYSRRRIGDRYVLASAEETDANLTKLLEQHSIPAPAVH